MTTQANEPAFPLFAEDKADSIVQLGLTKREIFAAMAIQGLASGIVSNTDLASKFNAEAKERGKTISILFAEDAVEMADALLEELSK